VRRVSSPRTHAFPRSLADITSTKDLADRIIRRTCKVNLMPHPCNGSFIQVRASAAYGVGLPKTCYWGLCYTLFWPQHGKLMAVFCWLRNMQFSDVVHGTVMCCHRLGHCCRIYGEANFKGCASGGAWDNKTLVFAECPCAAVESGILAPACNHVPDGAPSLTALTYLFKDWWAGASLAGFRMSRQKTYVTLQLGVDSACVSIRCSDAQP
jgi:hypothetical protein